MNIYTPRVGVLSIRRAARSILKIEPVPWYIRIRCSWWIWFSIADCGLRSANLHLKRCWFSCSCRVCQWTPGCIWGFLFCRRSSWGYSKTVDICFWPLNFFEARSVKCWVKSMIWTGRGFVEMMAFSVLMSWWTMSQSYFLSSFSSDPADVRIPYYTDVIGGVDSCGVRHHDIVVVDRGERVKK